MKQKGTSGTDRQQYRIGIDMDDPQRTFGIYLEWGFFTGKPGWKNILYYVFSIASLIFLVRRLIKKMELTWLTAMIGNNNPPACDLPEE